MKIAANELLKTIRQLELAVPKQNINPVLSCLKFSKNKIEAFNGIVFAGAKIDSDIDGLINASQFIEILSVLDKHVVKLNVNKQELSIKSGTFEAVLPIFQDKNNEISMIEGKSKFTKSEIEFASIIPVINDIIKNTYTLGFKGVVLYDKMGICVDGGFRMFRFGIKSKLFMPEFIPSEVLEILNSHFETPTLYVSKEYFKIEYEGIAYYVTLLKPKIETKYDEIFNDMKSKMQSKAQTISYDDKLSRAFERVEIVSKKSQDNFAILSYNDDVLNVNVNNQSCKVDENIKVDAGKKKWKILVNVSYVKGLLSFINGVDLYLMRYKEDSGVLCGIVKHQYYFVSVKFLEQ